MKHLNKKFYLWFLVIISGLAYLLLYMIYPKSGSIINFIDYMKPIPAVVFIDTMITFIFVKFLWKWKYFYPWLVPFPDLNGTWKGKVMSTWVDPITNERPDAIPVILTIKQSFTSISCIVRTEEMESFSFTSDFIINEDNQILKLVYSYDSIPKQTVQERSSQHCGTTILNVIYSKKKRELIGEYWTGRKTTGTLEFTFWKEECLDKFPKNIGKHPVGSIRKNEK